MRRHASHTPCISSRTADSEMVAGWRNRISSKMANGRSPGALFSHTAGFGSRGMIIVTLSSPVLPASLKIGPSGSTARLLRRCVIPRRYCPGSRTAPFRFTMKNPVPSPFRITSKLSRS